MSGFEEAFETSCFDPIAVPPFIAVRLGGSNFVVREVTGGGGLPASNHFVTVQDLTTDPAMHAIITAAKYGWLVGALDLIGVRDKNKRLLQLTGKAPGRTTLAPSSSASRASDKLDVAVLKPRTRNLSFKFLRRLLMDGSQTRTRWQPQDASDIMSGLNKVFFNANVTFNLASADWLDINERAGDTLSDEFFHKHLENKLSKDADVTVFFVGEWTSKTGGDGTTYPVGKSFGVAIDDYPLQPDFDDPKHQPQSASKVIIQTVAHELVHTFGFQGHRDRQGVLMSTKMQSLRLIKEAVTIINPV